MALIGPVEKNKMEKWDGELGCGCMCVCEILRKVDLWEKVIFKHLSNDWISEGDFSAL